MGHQKSISNQALKEKIRQLENNLSAVRGNGLSAEKLKSETEFLSYMRLLKDFAQRYCVLIVASDTPVGPNFSRDMANAVMAIGLNTNLYQKYRCAYAAVIDSGNVVFEEIKLDTTKEIRQKVWLEGNEIKFISIGYNCNPSVRRFGSIQINGTEHSLNRRGLNIVVWDKVTQTEIDSINFDTYADETPSFRPNDRLMIVNELNKYMEKHPGISVIGWQPPHFPAHNMTSNEQFIKNNDLRRGVFLANLDQLAFLWNKYYDKNGIMEVLSVPKSYHDIHGVRQFEDKRGKYVNIIGGHRATAYQPSHAVRTVYLVGGCTIFGIGADDCHTIASQLQDVINAKFPNSGVIVQNYGFFLDELDKRSNEELDILNALPVKQGDIIFFPCARGKNTLPYNIDLSKSAEYPRTYDVFWDMDHFTPDGNRLIAEKLFEGLLNMGVLESFAHAEPLPSQSTQNNYGFDSNEAKELAEYKKILVNWYQEMFGLTMGAVVINCNPFTLGHRYLIEKALEQCDYLVIFAVEEDKSDFPFEDRLKLIDEGVADLENVVVIPSGRFILSSLTFSEYFNKSKMQDRTVDTSLDVKVFAQEIAPCLNIKKRFAGEEPFDSVTRQYNETMRTILPEYNIEFIEIPRLELEGETVSASRVRTLLKERNFDAIKLIVPETTFQYLLAISSQD